MITASIALCTVAFVAACCVVDWRSRRIPNWLTGPALVVGIALNVALFGPPGAILSLGGIGIAAAVLLPPFALGGIGGGDVKMMAAIGAFLGWSSTIVSLVLGMILGGVIMIVYLLILGRFAETVRSLWRMVVTAILTRSVAPLRVTAGRPGSIALPYSIPLGAGTIGVIALGILSRG